MLQQMSQSTQSHAAKPNLNQTNHSQDFANRKMQVKAQVDQFKQSMEMLKRQPLNISGKQASNVRSSQDRSKLKH